MDTTKTQIQNHNIFKRQSIVYVNFAQYDNAGRILDFLTENFRLTVHFSFDHLRLKHGRKTNFLRLYLDGKLIEEIRLKNIRTIPLLLFPSLPLVAGIMVYQTLYHIIRLSRLYGTFDMYFTVNAFSALIGLTAKLLGLCRKTIFWVWDYFPLEFPDWRIRLIRKIYWQLDKVALKFSNHVAFTNKRLLNMIRKTRELPGTKKLSIVPVGTRLYSQTRKNIRKPIVLGFLGMLKESQGLDLILESIPLLKKTYPALRVEIIGSGPEEELFRKMARPYGKHVHFHGFIVNDDNVIGILKQWTIGLAPYAPLPGNESYWGDPSKIKTYLGVGLPVITTDVSYFTKEIDQNHAGIIIPYTSSALLAAIQTIIKKHDTFSKNARALGEQYNYLSLYPKLFE